MSHKPQVFNSQPQKICYAPGHYRLLRRQWRQDARARGHAPKPGAGITPHPISITSQCKIVNMTLHPILCVALSFKTIHNRNHVHVRPRMVSGVLAMFSGHVLVMFSGVIARCGNTVFQNPVPHTDQIFCAMIAGVGP